MQTISSTYFVKPNLLKNRRFQLVFVLLAVALSLVMGVFYSPSTAYAKSFEMPKVSINAQVETDGSFTVVEQREFDFSGDFTAVWWELGDNLPQNASIEINGLRMARVTSDDSYEDWTTLDSVSFQLEWRDAGGPGKTAYSFDLAKNTVYAFFSESDSHVVFEIDYRVINGAQAYSDIAEVYWKYVGSSWEEDSCDVTMTMQLPVPAGKEVVPGDNVRAWGHGPLDGVVTISPDGSVVYSVPRVNSGQFGEARIAFPVSWLTNLSSEAARQNKGTERLSAILKEEEAWADQANLQRSISLAIVIGSGLFCIVVLLGALISYFRFGKEYEPDFKDEYFRDVPEKGMHPAVIGRLWRWNKENQDDFTATLIHLSEIGAIRLDRGEYEKSGLFGKKTTKEDYYITKLVEPDEMNNKIDKVALEVLFDILGNKADSLWLDGIKAEADLNPERVQGAFDRWQGVLSTEVNQHEFVEAKSKRLQSFMAGTIVILFFGAIAIGVMFDVFLPLLFAIPTCIGLAVIANYMPRRTEYGNNLTARCKALRNWLKDFSSLDEKPPTDVKVWGEFMVYAYLFGVAKETIKQLQKTQPELFAMDSASIGSTQMPWWGWYYSANTATGTIMPSVGDVFDNISSTVTKATSVSSSGGGGGGGFSGGGGGGFGGGGGAR